MTLDKLLASLEKLSITLKFKDGKIAIPKGMLTDELRQAIIAHKPALIRHLQSRAEQAPVAALTDEPGNRRILSAIRVQYAINWFDRATRQIETNRKAMMADRGRQLARLMLPSSCRWLLDWLPKAKRVEFEARGDLAWQDWNAVVDLAWQDWNAVMREVRGKFERDCDE